MTIAAEARQKTERSIELQKTYFLNHCRTQIEKAISACSFSTDAKTDHHFALENAKNVLIGEGFKIKSTYNTLFISW